MNGTLTRLLWMAGVAMATAMPCGASSAAEVKDARVWAGPDYTRVVFDLSGPVHYKLSQQDGKVVIALPASSLAGGFNGPAAQGRFKGMTNTREGGTLQLAANVAPGSHPRDFMLGPSGKAGYRLVLDLYPDNAAAATKTVATAKTMGKPVVIPTAEVHRVSDFKKLDSRQVAALLGGERKVIVAVDAGHGGKDPGAHGPDGTLEKNVTLAVARDLAAQINKQPGMKAVLTRTGDYYIPLKRRYEIARADKADLFISIHADSYTSSDARGSSVWVLSSRGKSSVAARLLADRENSSDLIGGVSLAAENDSLASVLLDMQQGWAVQASDVVANNVLKALAQLGPTHRDHIEHANFVVLRSPDVPSILVETAFISNPTEERKLRNPQHQRALATAVMGGVKDYFESSPPPGTWFAAQAARRAGVQLASVDASAKSGAGAAKGGDKHRVARGESLSSIAHQYGVSVSSLKSANGISSNSLQAGTVLMIPTG
ncbi:N-acetylmuramoyl-L-alanine amidase [Rhodanobacter glycinis]|uniref:N-acetylmuramoyl-L-alanine amidase AmiC n=1 Tax=Rhodanobacter glycinis TaxID=582702 RepID=A0A1I3XSN3_9GAMM|nr:N-acetylmuramoyl-L-alanine amidase [Rhodanobacter glycinis]SFK22548.1 N-acetylmuramoyl-L-alanine amidase [Rhodanobacter glycinis]